MAYKVFISHAGTDTWVAKQINFYIKKLGAATFLDADNIEIGDQFEEIIFEELRTSNELLVLFTPWSLERLYVWLELGAAIVLGLRIIIVLHGITVEEITKNPRIPAGIKINSIISINDVDTYFMQLQNRLNLENK